MQPGEVQDPGVGRVENKVELKDTLKLVLTLCLHSHEAGTYPLTVSTATASQEATGMGMYTAASQEGWQGHRHGWIHGRIRASRSVLCN